MKTILCLGVLAVASMQLFAGAFYEGFTYAVGSVGGNINTNSTAGNQTWGVSTTGGPDNIVNAGSLSFAGLPASAGNSGMITNFTATNAKVDRIGIGGLNGNTSLYYSCLIRVADITGAVTGATGSFLAGFGTDLPTVTGAINNAVGRLQFRKDSVDGTTFNFGIRSDNSGVTGVSALPYETVQRTVGTTYFIVVEYEVNGATPTDDVSKIWINPVVGASNAAPDMTSTGGDLNALPIRSFFLRENTSGPRQVIIDELRIGRTWNYVMGAPEFDTQPANRTTNAFSTVNFFATVASSGAAVGYQWQKDGADLVDGGNVSGSTTTNLTLSSVLAADAGSYTLIASNTLGLPALSVTSSVATLTVVDPVITAQPSPVNQSVAPGSTVSYSVIAIGTATISYQWQKNGSPLTDGGVVSGATTSALTLTDVATGDSGSYTCAVTNGLGSGLVSGAAVLNVLDPAITSAPQSLTNNYGGTAVFSVVAAGTSPFTYQWLKNGVDLADGGNISGANTTALTVSAVSYLDAAGYVVVVTNNVGNTVTSSVATLTVRDPAITAQPGSAIKATGAPATFSVSAAGSALAYQWVKGTTVLADGGNISGATSSALTLATVSAPDAGSYTVVISNNLSSQIVTSSVVTLTVVDPPSARTVAAGVNVGFSPAVNGTGPFTYQWSSNGVTIAGATGAAYVLANAQPGYAATYSVDVTSAAGTASGSGTLTVVTTDLLLYETNIIVLRIGDGAQTPQTSGNSVFLDQYTPSGAYVNTVTLPDTGATPLVLNPNGTTSGALTRSSNGRLLCIAGYDTNTVNFGSGLSVEGSAATFPRVIGTISASSVYARPIKSTSSTLNGNAFRAAVTDGTNNFWASAAGGGTLYFTPPSTLSVIQSTKLNMRVSEIFNGDLYFSCASTVGDSHQGIYKFAGLPTVATPLPTPQLVEYGTLGANGPMDFAINGSSTILYGCDDRLPNGDGLTGGIRRYDFTGGAWVFSYTLTNGLLAGTTLRHLTVDFSGANPVLYATTSTVGSSPAQNLLVKVTDTGYQSGFSTLAGAGGNQTFKGVKFGPVADLPVITTAPLSRTNNAGTAATFTVAATGTASLTYQWNRGGTPLTDGGNVAGVATTALALASVSQADATNGSYTVVIANGFGSVTSTPVTLTVIDAPAITAQPASRTNVAGTLATFTVGYSGSTPAFVWKKDGTPLSDGGNVSGSGTETLALINVQDADAGTYTVSLTNSAGGVTSDPATLTVFDPAVITNPPGSRTNHVGTTATFSVTASGTAPLGYQWQKNGAPLADGGNVSGATTTELSLSNVGPPDEAGYTVVVSNVVNAVTSTPPATLTVELDPPVIMVQPASRTNLATATANFSVTATGTAPLSYQWAKDGTPLTDGGNVSGATTTGLALANVSVGDAAGYTVIITNAAGSVTSAPPAILTVAGPPIVTATVLDGPNLILSGNGGIEGLSYYLLTSPDVSRPRTNWAIVQTNAFGPGGSFSATNLVDAGQRTLFFRLLVP